jgi:hypothetical protein
MWLLWRQPNHRICVLAALHLWCLPSNSLRLGYPCMAACTQGIDTECGHAAHAMAFLMSRLPPNLPCELECPHTMSEPMPHRLNDKGARGKRDITGHSHVPSVACYLLYSPDMGLTAQNAHKQAYVTLGEVEGKDIYRPKGHDRRSRAVRHGASRQQRDCMCYCLPRCRACPHRSRASIGPNRACLQLSHAMWQCP